MAIELTLSLTGDRQVVASHNGATLATTSLSTLPRITAASNPYRNAAQENGLKLLQALGGDPLIKLLEAEAEPTLQLICNDESVGVPWEYACTGDGTFLCCSYGFVRLLPQAKPALPAKAGVLNFLALAADPLVDEQGAPRRGYKLQIDDELRAIDRRLQESEVAVRARRLPPLRKYLQEALSRGPAILHLSCHGNVVETNTGKLAVLLLEDENGKADLIRSDHLLRLWPPGVLRLALFSACRSAASAMDADLARTLVISGAPAAIGMQGDFPDPLSDDLAATLYQFLLAGHPLSEALRMARYALVEHAYAVGLPVCYMAPGGNAPLPLQAGTPHSDGLRLDRQVRLPTLLSQPRLLGREAELHDLARSFQQHKVVTVVGTGGIGKSALSGAFARRFGWRWPGGVQGVTLADQPTLNPQTIFGELVRQSLGDAAAVALANQPAEQILQAWIEANRDRPPLLLIDNYESVLDLLPERRGGQADEVTSEDVALTPLDAQTIANAQQLHRLVNQLANQGFALLLTSRQQPAGLSGEIVFPSPNRPLNGVDLNAGIQLFFENSTRANSDRRHFTALAEQIAQVTEGHPLAISLLAGEFDNSRQRSAEEFLLGWSEELSAAQRSGLAAHHVTFAVAFERSWRQLTANEQQQLARLSRFALPFFAEGALLLWGESLADEEAPRRAQLSAARNGLEHFVQRSLLRIESTFSESDQAATYRLEPVIGRTLLRHLPNIEAEGVETGYASYANWLVNRVYGQTGSDAALAQLTLRWLDELLEQAAAQTGEDAGWYCWRLAYLARQFGRMAECQQLLQVGEQNARNSDDPTVLGRILHERANLLVTWGDLDQALRLDQESLAIKAQLGDIKGRSATLHEMANVYVTRGDLDQALRLYQESLAIKAQLGDIKGRSVTLSMLANLMINQNRFEDAEKNLREALSIAEKLRDPKEIAFNLVKLGQVSQARGDVANARIRFGEGLAIFERLGMPEATQVRAMLAAFEGNASERSPLDLLLALSQAAAQGQQTPSDLAQACAQLTTSAGLPAAAPAYLAALSNFVRQPDATTVAALHGTAESLLANLQTVAVEAVLPLHFSLARLFARHDANESAPFFHAVAITALRAQGENQAAQQQLSIALYNHAGYLANANQLDQAVAALEEVVAIDQRWGLVDLTDDQPALAAMRRRRDGLPPDQTATVPHPAQMQPLLAAMQSQIEQLAPEEQIQVRQAFNALANASPEEQQALLLAQQRQQIEANADQVVNAVRDAVRQGSTAQLAPRLEAAAAAFGEDEAEGSPFAQLASFVLSAVALLRGQTPPPVPMQYAARLATVQQLLRK